MILAKDACLRAAGIELRFPNREFLLMFLVLHNEHSAD